MENCVLEVAENKKPLIIQNVERISKIFGVKSVLKDGGCGDEASLCLHLHNPSGEQETLQKAKAYVLSLMANDDVAVEETTERLTEEHFSRVLRDHEEIERDSEALLILNPNDRTVSIQGPRPSVLLAHAMVHRKLCPSNSGGGVAASTSTGQPQHHLVVAVKSTSSEEDERLGVYGGVTQSFSPGAESSHDSCYDSDGSPSASRRSSYARPGASHDDVSRTVSDTLAAERADDDPNTLGIRGLPSSTHKLLTPVHSLPASIEASSASRTSSPKISSKYASETHLQQRSDSRTRINEHLYARSSTGSLGQYGVSKKSHSPLQRTSSQATSSFSVSLSETGELSVNSEETGEFSVNSQETGEFSVGSQEISEFPPLDPQDGKVSSPETDSSEEFAQSAAYTPKVEFALKLGYSEAELREVLHKCGRDLSQNELLSELIKLGANPAQGGKYTVRAAEQDMAYFKSDANSVAFNSEALGTEDLDVEIEYEQEESSGVVAKVAAIGGIGPEEITADDTGNAFLSALIGSAKSQDHKSAGAAGGGKEESNLRYIVIDGSNLAMSHGGKEVFSCVGIQLAVNWFKQRGHKEITVFVPQWRKETTPRPETPIKDQDVLLELEKDKVLVFTPARRVQGKRVVCYDDRYIIKLAAETGGIIVSNDHYKDLVNENQEFKKVIEERLLMYSFVNDRFMPPDDPLGRHGPSLDNFLLKEPTVPEPQPPNCPYAKKCTYGNKCKYFHPERGSQPHKSVTEKLAEQAKVKIQEVKERPKNRDSSPGDIVYNKKPLTSTLSESAAPKKTPLSRKAPLGRTKSLTPAIMVTSALSTVSSHATASQSGSGGGGHPKLSKAASSNTFTVGGKEGLKVTLTADVEKWQSYDDLLSAYRKKIQASEAQEKERLRMGVLGGESGQGSRGAEAASLQPPVHWSQQSGHESLRHTHSDPPGMHYPDAAPGTLGGHLALAKTLSDEGKQHPEMQGNVALQQHAARTASRNAMGATMQQRQGQQQQQQQQQMRQKSPKGRKVSPHNHSQPEANQHRKLQRQLSLKGAEDPRVQEHRYRDASNARPLQAPPPQFPHPQLQARQSAPAAPNKPSFRFHGHEGPHNPHIRIAGHHSRNFPGDPTIPPGWQQEISPLKPALMKKEKAPLTRHSSFGPSHPAMMHPAQREQHVQAHAPLGRMASAPGTYFNKSQEQEERLPIPRLTRQNSTSEPQLHPHPGEDQIGVPFESYTGQDGLSSQHSRVHWSQGSRDSESFEDIINPMADMFLEQRSRMPASFGIPPPSHIGSGYNGDQSRRQLDANQDRLTPPNVPFGQQGPVSQTYVQFGSNQIKIPIEEPPIFDPTVPPPPVLPHPLPTGHSPLSMHTPPRTASPVRKNSPLTMSPVHHQALRQQRSNAASGGDQYRLSPPPGPIQPPSSAPPDQTSTFNLSKFSYGPFPMASPNSGSSLPFKSDHGSWEHIPAAIGTGRKMTPPLSQGSDIISPDTRASIYYHLSGLFPEDKVQAVMEAFPSETDPSVLCAHIIKMT